MKRLLTLIAVLGFVACGTRVANANDLYNPDLDILGAAGANGQVNPGPDGWQIVATKSVSGSFNDGADSETFCNVQQPNGYGLFFKPFQGSTNGGPGLYDLLSVYFSQDNPSSAGTKCTLSGYASCEANFCGLLPAPSGGVVPQVLFEVLFLDNSGNILSSNAFDLIANGMPTAGPSSMAQLTTPSYTAPAGTFKVRVGATMLNAYGTSGAQSFFVDAFDLESVAPPGSPVITNQPVAASVSLGGTAVFNVGVSNTLGVTNAWLFNGAPISDSAGHISGSTTATLTITGVLPADVGKYQAIVSNGLGLSRSKVVALAITGIALDPVIGITGPIGSTYEVDWTTSLTPPITWTMLTTVKLASSPQNVLDTSPGASSRYYRAVFLH
ncbi:MAG: immunoglobulin domain-containing protein [Verrucomicrobiia bacterium]